MISQPRLIIHGGIDRNDLEEKKEKFLLEIAIQAYEILVRSNSLSSVLFTLSKLEDNSLFNAGRGARLQSDGIARLSSGLMDGKKNKFYGVINIQDVKPSEIIKHLLHERDHTILAGIEAKQYAISKGLKKKYNPITKYRIKELLKTPTHKSGTVGCVAIDTYGSIIVGTSTGGVGGETPGRVGDSATIAGTYATSKVGISCTGIGEHIIYQAIAPKIAFKIEIGKTLKSSVLETISEANDYDYHLGLIALDCNGNFEIGQTKGTKVRYVIIQDSSTILTWRKN